jgi:hypothetical protein
MDQVREFLREHDEAAADEDEDAARPEPTEDEGEDTPDE